MTGTTDPAGLAGLVTREVRTGSREGKATKIAVARRRYNAERPDVWDALTNTERLPRWFLPVSGDLSVGGHYRLEGNASGVVESCKEPESFAVTWEFGGQVTWLEVHLSETDDGTTLELLHEAHVDPDMWAQFGPGAVGLGWDLALRGFGLHLDSGTTLDPDEAEAWALSSEGAAFGRAAGEDWARAAVEDGDDPEAAKAAAENSIAFYTTKPEAEPEG